MKKFLSLVLLCGVLLTGCTKANEKQNQQKTVQNFYQQSLDKYFEMHASPFWAPYNEEHNYIEIIDCLFYFYYDEEKEQSEIAVLNLKTNQKELFYSSKQPIIRLYVNDKNTLYFSLQNDGENQEENWQSWYQLDIGSKNVKEMPLHAPNLKNKQYLDRIWYKGYEIVSCSGGFNEGPIGSQDVFIKNKSGQYILLAKNLLNFRFYNDDIIAISFKTEETKTINLQKAFEKKV